ncbi:hypothetical protein ACH5RR_018432 [Cinchona calisaya]|uniref:Transposase MuDR plant domain-containing protein n=1 Tax=Cinchona calisaya TaxID=153742 RepID=A0ABD2ZMQ0_9GENT
MKNPTFELGMKLANKREFKEVIDNNSIVNGKDIYRYTRDRDTVRAKRKSPCKWFVYVLEVKALGTHDLVVKLIWRYATELKRSNVDTIVEVMFTPFREPGCNPRSTLTVMGVDPNNGSWPIAWAIVENEAKEQCNVEMYELKMRELKDYDAKAFAWVKNASPPENWCLDFFSHHTKCDMILNNICESSNSHILEVRDNPIISMLEIIRKNLITRIKDRSTWMRKSHGLVGPAIRQIIDDTVKISRKWNPLSNGKAGYEVKGPRGEQNNGDPHYCADPCYSRDLFLQIYDNILQPTNGKDLWPLSDEVDLDPPIPCVPAGGRGVEVTAACGASTAEPIAGARETNAGTTGVSAGSATNAEEPAIVSNANVDGNDANSEGNNGNVLVGCKKRNTSQPRRRQIPIQTPQPLVNTERRTSTHTPSAIVHKRVAQNKKRLAESDTAMINSNYAYLGKEHPFKVGRCRGRSRESKASK